MGEIRVFTEEHVRDVADLNMRAMRGRKESASIGLQNCFRDIFLQNPWASADIPSLVYLDGGKLVGFLGVVPRTMEFRGRPIRAAITSQFMIDRDQHRGGAAMSMLRQLFRGPQELSFSDGAAEGAGTVWTAAGGRAASLYSLNWTRVLRPLETARGVMDRGGGAWPALKAATGAFTAPGDFLLSKLPLGVLRPPHSDYSSKPVSSQELLDCIQEIGWKDSLKPVYTQPSFDWLMKQANSQAGAYGPLRMLTVHDAKGSRVAWYVHHAKPRGISYVLQIGFRRRDQFSNTLLALFRDAWDAGCSVVKGQMIPQFLTTLTEQHCVFRHPTASFLFHSTDPQLVSVVERGEAAITRLDGEWWMRFGTQS
jgi:hypothetical protein